MNNAFKIVKRYFDKALGLLPSPLPTGMSEFTQWAESIRATYSLPTQDADSVHWALASMVMHLGPTTAFKSKYYFVLAIRAGAAKQIAGACFQEIKNKHEAAKKAAEEKAKAEVTAASAVTSIESQR